MFVDASVMLAILLQEPQSDRFITALEEAAPGSLCTSVIAVWEAAAALYRKKSQGSMAEAQERLGAFIRLADIVVLPVTPDDNDLALRAFDLHGRHRHVDDKRNDALNLADCFHYAVAKSRNVPILTKDAGFALTDIRVIGVDF
ncbi:type II toxin-antitoxin system VapC family toxin [Rhizobium sp. OAE497]|uniref:type II toxin-antitoxin system VapC family toxin n=1 Tax=Rhizobium sp. OAE497 TaxID=2663796 RepID=UPI0018F76E5A